MLKKYMFVECVYRFFLLKLILGNHKQKVVFPCSG